MFFFGAQRPYYLGFLALRVTVMPTLGCVELQGKALRTLVSRFLELQVRVELRVYAQGHEKAQETERKRARESIIYTYMYFNIGI